MKSFQSDTQIQCIFVRYVISYSFIYFLPQAVADVSCPDLHVGEEPESVLLRARGQSHAAERLNVYVQLPLQHQCPRGLKHGEEKREETKAFTK